MTGQIPKYGEHFALKRAAEWSPTLASSVYALKIDPRWLIRSDKTSKKWTIFFAYAEVGEAIPVSIVMPSLGRAMGSLLSGIKEGYYAAMEGT